MTSSIEISRLAGATTVQAARQSVTNLDFVRAQAEQELAALAEGTAQRLAHPYMGVPLGLRVKADDPRVALVNAAVAELSFCRQSSDRWIDELRRATIPVFPRPSTDGSIDVNTTLVAQIVGARQPAFAWSRFDGSAFAANLADAVDQLANRAAAALREAKALKTDLCNDLVVATRGSFVVLRCIELALAELLA